MGMTGKIQPLSRRALASGAVAFLCLLAGCNPVGGIPDATPTVEIVPTLTSAAASKTNPVPVSIAWTSAVTGFSADHMVVINGTVQNFSGSGAAYSFEVVPIIEGDILLAFPPAAGVDSDGNGTTLTVLTVKYDLTGPSVSLTRRSSQSRGTGSVPIYFDAVFSEAIDTATFTAADITQTGFASGLTWTVTDSGDHINFTVAAIALAGNDGTIIPRIVASAVKDVAGNNSLSSTGTDNKVTYLTNYDFLKLWLTADTLTNANGSNVTSWTDISASVNHATEATNPPTFLTGAQNSLPVVRFVGGTSQILRTTNDSGIIGNPDFTVFVVARINSSGSNFPVFLQFNEGAVDGTSAWFGLDSTFDFIYTGFYGGGSRSALSYDSDFNLYTWVRTSGAGGNAAQTGNTQFWNGTSRVVGNSLANPVLSLTDGKMRIGRSGVNTTIDADIGEILLFNGTAMDNTNRGAVETYLNSKWALW
jgi:hypothetical protein